MIVLEKIFSILSNLVNAIIEKYRQQRPLPQTFGKYGVCQSIKYLSF